MFFVTCQHSDATDSNHRNLFETIVVSLLQMSFSIGSSKSKCSTILRATVHHLLRSICLSFDLLPFQFDYLFWTACVLVSIRNNLLSKC